MPLESPLEGASHPVVKRGGNLLVKLIVNATAALVGRAKACRTARGKLPNLVAVDMFASGGLLAAVKQLNALK